MKSLLLILVSITVLISTNMLNGETIAKYFFNSGSRASEDDQTWTTANEWNSNKGSVSSSSFMAFMRSNSGISNTLEIAIQNGCYHSFSIDVDTEQTLSLGDLDFDYKLPPPVANKDYTIEVLTSVTAFTATNSQGFITFNDSNPTNGEDGYVFGGHAKIDLSAISGLTGMGAIEIRLYILDLTCHRNSGGKRSRV